MQDATRYTELRRLPPVLHISLLRFVFDMSTLERKKCKHSVNFPKTIDMSQFLSCQGQENVSSRKNNSQHDVYHLRGVLLHKGASAYHGHYEAQVFDVE
jgi:ubiquitin C-terminal hydrolase